MKFKLNRILLPIALMMGLCITGCGGSDEPQPEPTPNPTPTPDPSYQIDLESMLVRDPFILVDRKDKSYYLHYNNNLNIYVYKSKDLKKWKNEGASFVAQEGFWAKSDFWAPDVYEYEGKYYMLVTFSNSGYNRGTSILVSDRAKGPFTPLVNAPITPKGMACLDGAIYTDTDGSPWLLFCHEWLEAIDGEIYAQRLAKDLKTTIGEPQLLFTATDAPWVGAITSGGVRGYVTDAPFIYRLDNGKLIMTWSSYRKADGKYAIGQATSESGSVLGPWKQEAETLNSDDGGHAMVFEDLDGNLMISYHAPNTGNWHPIIEPIYIKNDKFSLSK